MNLSEQFAYWNMAFHTNDRSLVAMLPRLQQDGACPETTWPYVPVPIPGNDAQDPPPPHAVARALSHRPGHVLQVAARSVPAIQAQLSAGRVVPIAIPVYASWMDSPVVRKYGNITVPIPGEVPEPTGHAVALVGYADNADFAGGGYFIVRNSWGTSWGVNGFGYLHPDYITAAFYDESYGVTL